MLRCHIVIWISDIIMTFFKTLTTLYPFLFITMLLFINSETLLFIAYLWIIFNYLWICNINSILLPDPTEYQHSNFKVNNWFIHADAIS